ncbi:uncharacterized protein LOC117639197 [Thrips palmi]|uniref:Uncharacterized protein LOC117639197 n=1 Tax=Thrips palmi TaxID=161013 RepID=A0A6P8Y380_THRPL|nr:uncharacterized protein LOC117639197 [Thrips palmi]
MNKSRESLEANAKLEATAQLAAKRESLRKAIADLEASAKEKCMLAGSLAARVAAQTAVLETERAKTAVLRSTLERLDALSAASAGASGGSPEPSSRDAWTQTEDDAEALREELRRLHQKRDELLAKTRGMPKVSQHMVELLKKRNAVLLAREQRALERTRAERLEKEKRVVELQERLAFLRASFK